MRITTLMDNVAYKRGLRSEHGFSALIDTGDARVLFDTGQTGAFLANAECLREDLSSVDVVVLSHGHYDHTGGLESFCRINTRARIYGKPSCRAKKYVGDAYIGMPGDVGKLRERFVDVETTEEIVPGVYVVPEIPIRNEWDTHFKKFLVRGTDGVEPDTFEDELFLTLALTDGQAVISGCSHRGITNIVLAAREAFRSRVLLVLGGFHVKDETAAAVHRMMDEVDRLEVVRLGVCHCTGVDGYASIKARRPDSAFYNHAGNIVDL